MNIVPSTPFKITYTELKEAIMLYDETCSKAHDGPSLVTLHDRAAVEVLPAAQMRVCEPPFGRIAADTGAPHESGLGGPKGRPATTGGAGDLRPHAGTWVFVTVPGGEVDARVDESIAVEGLTREQNGVVQSTAGTRDAETGVRGRGGRE